MNDDSSDEPPDERTDVDDEAFTYNGGRVDPGESANIRYSISETYLGDPVKIPVTVINGSKPGPTVFLSAAAHGDELNGIEVVREVAHDWDHSELHGTLVCLPVMNVPGFLAQERYLPIYDRDLNRSFPGREGSTSARRMANRIFTNFIEPCDLGIDFTRRRADERTCSTSARQSTIRQSVVSLRRSVRTSSSVVRVRPEPFDGRQQRRAFRRSPSRWVRHTASSAR